MRDENQTKRDNATLSDPVHGAASHSPSGAGDAPAKAVGMYYSNEREREALLGMAAAMFGKRK